MARLIHTILISFILLVLSGLLFLIIEISLREFMPDFSYIHRYLNGGLLYFYILIFISYLIAPKIIK